ncbi:hypothetical protein OIU74_021541 [Salix koriyanagi]|uniref:Uncharacterized protein n=1 Tax=Salix koriyanagi TaxID=2511006 RepID=A0A9Q0WKQ9_9ROSI|nr:hypothetical protein OIU74_021541 [Salix koriyanagi]
MPLNKNNSTHAGSQLNQTLGLIIALRVFFIDTVNSNFQEKSTLLLGGYAVHYSELISFRRLLGQKGYPGMRMTSPICLTQGFGQHSFSFR